MKFAEKFDHALYKRLRHKRNRKHILLPTIITTLSLLFLIFVLETLNVGLRKDIGYSAIIFTSFAGSAFIMFMMPYSHASNIRRMIKAYVIAGIFGELGYLLTGVIGFYAASALTLFFVALLLFETDSAHPPAMGIAFAFVIFQVNFTGLFVVVVGVTILVLIKVALEKLGINP